MDIDLLDSATILCGISLDSKIQTTERVVADYLNPDKKTYIKNYDVNIEKLISDHSDSTLQRDIC